MLALLRTFSWQDLRHHPWRSAAAVAAVMLGVALAFAVHVINASALDEFSQAVRAVNGQPDLEVRPMQGTLGEDLFAQVATHPDVARANPVLEATAMARPATQAPGAAPIALRLLGRGPESRRTLARERPAAPVAPEVLAEMLRNPRLKCGFPA